MNIESDMKRTNGEKQSQVAETAVGDCIDRLNFLESMAWAMVGEVTTSKLLVETA
jgi:hypothetical protein